mmetsp:Transcript_28264/g.40997  ORF Transcript_28264/g.40997 Transcript_28264/m.40997 type:complete len:666 (+) Transcript_28264:667-2664(+)
MATMDPFSDAMSTNTTASLVATVSLEDKTSGVEIYKSSLRNEGMSEITTNRRDVISSRPILVGYAFGPKKMSTMGIIMAEASKALSTVTTTTSSWSSSTSPSSSSPRRLTPAALEKRARQFDDTAGDINSNDVGCDVTEDGEESSVVSLACPSFASNQTTAAYSSINYDDSGENFLRFNFYAGGNNAGMNNITRFFRSSCSSAASLADSSITTGTAGTVAVTQSQTSSARIDVLRKSDDSNNSAYTQSIRVSFVPLDLDSPLEEQHGGKFDAILHKMTEDILCLSNNPPRKDEGDAEVFSPLTSITSNSDDNAMLHARERVGRLVAYKRDHPECCLVDHPSNVQALMSRSDIARVLSDCLVGVTTRSGTPVRTPRFLVIDKVDERPPPGDLAEQIEQSPFTYPIIAKPLTAAGTKESHKMAVILGRSGLNYISHPCLLQEYANHGGTLFKVYVLGDAVRVFARPSLPDLPTGDRHAAVTSSGGYVEKNTSDCECYVEFDSQRPYPRLSDFGMVDEDMEMHNNRTSNRKSCDLFVSIDGPMNRNITTSHGHKKLRKRSLSPSCRPPPPKISKKAAAAAGYHLTADEIRPVATVLKKAFGLELFGFDVLVKKRELESGDSVLREMLVVDVNYFPSYKEVSNFPSLLAQYLTQRAIEGRIKKLQGDNT